MAIKKIERGKLNDEEWAKLQREPHIVDYLYSCGWESTMAEICMGLKDGSLEKLVLEPPLRIEDVAQTVLHQMLQATDCLATHGIVHRDIKPENILYVFRQSKYHFCLADFGLSNREDLATTFSGTPIYMAPEILHRAKQTHKADIWSLFVTMLWTLDIKGFRQASASAQNLPQVQTEISSRIPTLRVIQDMAREDPDERASAAQMLVKCFDGRGLVTPRNQVPPLGYPTIPDIAMPESKRSRGTKNEKSAVTGRFRIEKPLKAKQPRGRFQVQDRGDAQF
ncbi:hypothetical protein N0V84_005248 [Fusarium piperis]|uniref:non-specific serine/threonine protein kinase n=1 Tax=Fusarium piperis TaxID=1435070 RepID=A0A9W8WE27_9HYPO|nr:hypothetical protein N0V84_005248 [Fusarium piperis]